MEAIWRPNIFRVTSGKKSARSNMNIPNILTIKGRYIRKLGRLRSTETCNNANYQYRWQWLRHLAGQHERWWPGQFHPWQDRSLQSYHSEMIINHMLCTQSLEIFPFCLSYFYFHSRQSSGSTRNAKREQNCWYFGPRWHTNHTALFGA